MIRFFLTRVLSWIGKISWTEFLQIVSSASNAASLFPKADNLSDADKAAVNVNRAAHVSNVISRVWKTLPTWAVNLVRELAVAWFNREAKK